MVGSLAGLVRLVPDPVQRMALLVQEPHQDRVERLVTMQERELPPLAVRLAEATAVRASRSWNRSARGALPLAGMMARQARVMRAKARRPRKLRH